jgi:hypothetical protein
MCVACTLTRLPSGWSAQHDSEGVGHVEVKALTRNEAIEKIEGEIRYRLELCPCTGETYRHIEIDIVEQPPKLLSDRS